MPFARNFLLCARNALLYARNALLYARNALRAYVPFFIRATTHTVRLNGGWKEFLTVMTCVVSYRQENTNP